MVYPALCLITILAVGGWALFRLRETRGLIVFAGMLALAFLLLWGAVLLLGQGLRLWGYGLVLVCLALWLASPPQLHRGLKEVDGGDR